MSEYSKEVAKNMERYMHDQDNIDKEVHDLKHAITGAETRGALAASVSKAFTKSKESEVKSDEAHEVMESIMQEGFDNAALENNFAEKLDDEIANLQPKWTGFKDNVTQQLTDIAISVLSQGEVADGETDNSEAINRIINTANVMGSPTYFPDGHYIISDSIDIPSHMKLIISDNAIFTKKDGLTTYRHMFKAINKRNISIIGGEFDGNRGNTSAGYCFYFEETDNIYIEGIKAKKGSIGMHFEACDNIIVDRSVFHDNSSDGLSIDGGCSYILIDRSLSYNHTLEGNTSGETAGSGFEFDEGTRFLTVKNSYAYNNIIGINIQHHYESEVFNGDITLSNCHVYDSELVGIRVQSSADSDISVNLKILSCNVKSSKENGIRVSGFKNIIIFGNYLDGNGYDAIGPNSDGIRVTSTKTGLITHNTLVDKEEIARYPVSLETSSEDFLIEYNNIIGYREDRIHAPNSTVKNNLGLRKDISIGKETILKSRDFYIVEHINSRMPETHQIDIKFLSETGDLKNWWILEKSITGNAFRIEFDNSPGKEVEFMWEIDYTK